MAMSRTPHGQRHSFLLIGYPITYIYGYHINLTIKNHSHLPIFRGWFMVNFLCPHIFHGFWIRWITNGCLSITLTSKWSVNHWVFPWVFPLKQGESPSVSPRALLRKARPARSARSVHLRRLTARFGGFLRRLWGNHGEISHVHNRHLTMISWLIVVTTPNHALFILHFCLGWTPWTKLSSELGVAPRLWKPPRLSNLKNGAHCHHLPCKK